jgi:hypothetical protein
MGAHLQGGVQGRVDPAEVRVFWIALVAFPILWGLLFIVALFGFKFRWLVSFISSCNLCMAIYTTTFLFQLLVCIGLTLNGANLYGYIKCKAGLNKELSFAGLTNNFIREQVVQNVMNPP